MTWKYTTAFTFTDTLSRVMTSCGGTSRTTVRREIRIIVSKGQKMNVRPGPWGWGESRPSQNVTALAYSFRMLIHFEMKTITTKTTGTISARLFIRAPGPRGGPA